MASAYFSHSYRMDDQPFNKLLWDLISEQDLTLLLDPPSGLFSFPRLERQISLSDSYLGVFNFRREVPRHFCSPYVRYEYGLSVQARRPRLLLIDERLGPRPALQSNEVHYFSTTAPFVATDELRRKLSSLRRAASPATPLELVERRPVGFLLPNKATTDVYNRSSTQEAIARLTLRWGFMCKFIKVPTIFKPEFALQLDECDLAILDVRGDVLPEWIFAYAQSRSVPSIKVAHVQGHELPNEVKLPSLVEGLRIDEYEPCVETVIYWRTVEDLTFQLGHEFERYTANATVLKSNKQGVIYFGSIGRRRTKVFISNSASENVIAERLSNELVLQNFEYFNYNKLRDMEAGEDWMHVLERELESCQIFVALVGPDYRATTACVREAKIATRMARSGCMRMLPYRVSEGECEFFADIAVADVPDNRESALQRIMSDIDKFSKSNWSDWERRRPKLGHGSMELVIDAVRHLSPSGRRQLLGSLDSVGIAVGAKSSRAKVAPRAYAENLLQEVERADTSPALRTRKTYPVIFLVDRLSELSLSNRRPALKAIGRRLKAIVRG